VKSPSIFREVFKTFFAVLIVIIAFAMSAGFIPYVAELLYAIVAFVFIKAAQRMMDKKELSSESCGITWKRFGNGLLWGIGATLVTLPLFIAGFVLWETQVLERKFEFNTENYWHWPISIEGEPKGWGQETGVWVWSDKQTLNVGIRNHGQPNNRVTLSSTTPFLPSFRGGLVMTPTDSSLDATQAQNSWSFVPASRGRGVVRITRTHDIQVQIQPIVETNPTWQLFEGRNQKEVKDANLKLNRGLWWIALWVATQFLLIAYPEEYFYRGWMQSRLQLAFENRAKEHGREPFSLFGFTPAILVTSFLFGIGHLLVPIGGVWMVQRMSVFFPSLIFGWLRHRTGSITAPVFYHACCNLMVLLIVVHVI